MNRMDGHDTQWIPVPAGGPVMREPSQTHSPRPGDKAVTMNRVLRPQSCGGFSLTDTLISSVILVIAVLGNSNYRYQSMLLAQRADMWRSAATVAQLLSQSWAGVQGISTYDPVSSLSPGISLATNAGPSQGAGFTWLGSYRIDLNGTRYFATLSWQDVQSGLRALNVKVAWSQSERGSTTFSDADKSYALTTYYVTP